MIIGLAASLVTSVAGFLFPILASFKALKANDISQLTPWLMYWSVMGCLLFVEHWSYLILQWVPLYRQVKMILVLWMVLPQTQGATYLYLHYLHPRLVMHERDLDKLVFSLHQQAMQHGAAQLQRLMSFIQDIIFDKAAIAPEAVAAKPPPVPTNEEGFFNNLLSRFRTVPVGSSPETIPTTLMGFISSYSRTWTHGTASAPAADIVPSHLQPEERANYIALQKQRLTNWLQLLDQAMSQPAPVVTMAASTQEQDNNENGTPSGGKKTKSRNVSGRQTPIDSDFEDLGQDDIVPMRRMPIMTSGREGGESSNASPRSGWFRRGVRSASSKY